MTMAAAIRAYFTTQKNKKTKKKKERKREVKMWMEGCMTA